MMFLLLVIVVLLGACALRLSEILGELQDVAHRGRRLYPLTRAEREDAGDAAEGEAWRERAS